jgi:hypothetical protein
VRTRIIAAALVAATLVSPIAAQAQWNRYGGGYGGGYGRGYTPYGGYGRGYGYEHHGYNPAPAIIGGALLGLGVGAAILSQPRYYAPRPPQAWPAPPVYYAPPPVVYAPPPVYYAQPPAYYAQLGW